MRNLNESVKILRVTQASAQNDNHFLKRKRLRDEAVFRLIIEIDEDEVQVGIITAGDVVVDMDAVEAVVDIVDVGEEMLGIVVKESGIGVLGRGEAWFDIKDEAVLAGGDGLIEAVLDGG